MKNLYFLHIPKTAGTTIESISKRQNIHWGCHHKFPENVNVFKDIRKGLMSHHYPLDYFTEEGLKYLKDFDIFTVVRNPISKIVSAYNCKWYNDGKTYNTDTKEQFNEKILSFIDKDKNETSNKYLPQHRYVYLNGKKFVKHVIKFENLNKEFDTLMSNYNLDIKLGDAHHNKKDGIKHTKDDLYPETIELIKKHYKKDFQLFRY